MTDGSASVRTALVEEGGEHLAAALDYAARWGPAGAGVLPLDGKVPVDPATGRPMVDWHRRATADPATLRCWWSERAWNVGVAPRGAFIALDIDRRHGDDDRLHELEQELGELPPTSTYQTSDGWRVLLASPGVPLASEIDGIKIVFKKGQIVMPPSVHPTGFVYRWEADLGASAHGSSALPRPARGSRPATRHPQPRPGRARAG